MAVSPAESHKPRGKTYGTALDAAALGYQMAIRGWNRADLARKAKLANSTVTDACEGRRVTPSVQKKIADALAAEVPHPELVAITPGPIPA